MQVAVRGRDDGVRRKVVATEIDPLVAGAAAHLRSDWVQAEVLLYASLKVLVLRLAAHCFTGDDFVVEALGRERSEQLGTDVRVARQLEEEAADSAGCSLGAGKENFCHLVDDVTGVHGSAGVRLLAFLDQVLEKIAAFDIVYAFAALDDGVDSGNHLGGPVELNINAERTEELLDVDGLQFKSDKDDRLEDLDL